MIIINKNKLIQMWSLLYIKNMSKLYNINTRNNFAKVLQKEENVQNKTKYRVDEWALFINYAYTVIHV